MPRRDQPPEVGLDDCINQRGKMTGHEKLKGAAPRGRKVAA
jgi:hypothetical protein